MKGCLFFHGFTGGPHEILPLADHLREHTDWKIHAPTLPGHGEHQSLYDADWLKWKRFADQQCEQMLDECDELSIVGFSMGGMLAAYLSTSYPIERLVLLSPAVFALNPTQIVEDISQLMNRDKTKSDVLMRDMERYKSKVTNTPIRAILEFRKLIRNLRPYIDYIDVPVLLLHGKKDGLVDPESSQYIYEQIKSKEKKLIYLENSKHMICHDQEARLMFPEIEQFLHKARVKRS